jgi:hypothetical protein
MHQRYHDNPLLPAWQAIDCSPWEQRPTRYPNHPMLWEHPDTLVAWAFQQQWERQHDATRRRLVRAVRALTVRQPTPLRRTVWQVGRKWRRALAVLRTRCTRVLERRRQYGTSDIASHSH